MSRSCKLLKRMERETGIEPATSSLGSWHSTAELLPLTWGHCRTASEKKKPNSGWGLRNPFSAQSPRVVVRKVGGASVRRFRSARPCCGRTQYAPTLACGTSLQREETSLFTLQKPLIERPLQGTSTRSRYKNWDRTSSHLPAAFRRRSTTSRTAPSPPFRSVT